MYLAHHGIKGQKWGVRRYQNPDGTLTSMGRLHYGKELRKMSKLATKENATKADKKNFEKQSRKFIDTYGTDEYYKTVVNSGLRHAGRKFLESYMIFPNDPAYIATRAVVANYDYVHKDGTREVNPNRKHLW